TVLEKSPSKEVQGSACIALAQFLKNRAATMEQLKARPQFAAMYEKMLGKEYLAELKKLDPARAATEVGALPGRAGKDYADVKHGFRGTIGAVAKSELFEIRHLAVGKLAPDIEGVDQDGKKFKLSDYKGKVVMLDFWNEG